MNSELKIAIETSKFLNEDQKKRCLERIDGLTPKQVKKVLDTLKDSGKKYSHLVRNHIQKKIKIKKNYLRELKHLVPKFAKKLEAVERSQEIMDGEKLLSQINKAQL